MYVVPFSMGPPGSSLSRYGVQITDHPYVAVSLSLVTRTGTEVLSHLGDGGMPQKSHTEANLMLMTTPLSFREVHTLGR